MKADASWLRYLPGPLRRWLQGRAELQAALGNSGWLVADRAVRGLVGFTVIVVLARMLGPQQFGLLTYCAAIVWSFSALAGLGLDGLVVKRFVTHAEDKDAILGTALGMRLAGSLLVIALSAAAVMLLRPGDSLAARLVVVLAAANFFVTFDAIDLWFQSRVKSRYTVLAKLGPYVAINLAKIGFVLAGASVMVIAWIALFEMLACAAALCAAYVATGGKFRRLRFRPEDCRRLLLAGWPLALVAVFITVRMRVDQVMLGQMVDDAAVAAYSVASRLVELWYVGPVFLATSLFPMIIRSRELGEQRFLARMQRLYDGLVWAAVLTALAITVLAPWLMPLLFGEGYRQSAGILIILIWMSTWVFFGVARSRWLLAEGQVKPMLYVEALALALNVIANFCLIPRLGAIGAAWSALFAVFAANGLVAVFSPSIRLSMVMYGRAAAAPMRYLRRG
ncbi:MAG TPA: flippase [Burkholderiales bacterium]|nr:flippase [Burkholderiales bacterium]